MSQLTEVTGNLLDPNNFTATDESVCDPLDAIAHGVNVEGVMGAGVARAIKDAYIGSPMFSRYRFQCDTGRLAPGGCWYYDPTDFSAPRHLLGRGLYNLATQDLAQPGAARLDWLRRATLRMIIDAEERDIQRIGLPEIGCGIGGLSWVAEVRPWLEALQDMTTVELVVFHLPEKSS